ncbi:MAG: alanine--tRNA ligase [Caldiserica bacterium]|jgi:alanyl-tRNA synthetase|nr:alanine--tRNA ligase [Caldisericota bacterium]MDH7561946.1 alanine--tRNA ligase [Caldisericota bacterium]
MNSDSLRHEFLKFFEEKGHLVQPGISLVPEDPTLLFTSAGMVPMKPFFLGLEEPPSLRLATIQKCFRTTDIENVGRTPRHLTFLEMLGNFSVGDYFKRGAILFAWEFLTERLKIPKDRLWISVFREDDEAFLIWEKEVGVPPDRIVRLNEEDNFWGPVGTTGTGPCGPCSEIHFDLGPELGPPAKPGDDSPRLVEVWNLVFMEFNKNEKGELEPLKKKNIDTGMGLERLAMVVQGKKSVFETDLFWPLIEAISSLPGVINSQNEEKRSFALRTISDHLRALTFLISDGVIPTNEGRGYVLRRVIRRAFRYSRYLGLKEPFLFKLVPEVVRVMGGAYPELMEKSPFISRVVKAEEERFCATLEDGLNLLEETLKKLSQKGERVIPGEEVFRLSDTFGFPWELTEEIARESGMEIDRQGFEKEMEKQRERARAALKKVGMELSPLSLIREREGETRFIGYDFLQSRSKVIGILKEGNEVDSLLEGSTGEVLLDCTPFYPERGGQVGDRGRITWEGGEAVVIDTQVPFEGLIVHKIKVKKGSLQKGTEVHAEVDQRRRAAIARAHTATHLLHFSLRKIVGPHALQAGSLVEPDRLRFDFSHFEQVGEGELRQIETMVNNLIQENYPVEIREMPLAQAKKEGIVAIFGEKYRDPVRAIFTGPSKELCGGTHVDRTGDIGFFIILQETGVGSNLRRIEALTGELAVEKFQEEREKLKEIGRLLNAPQGQEVQKLKKLLEEKDEEGQRAIFFRDRILKLLSSALKEKAIIQIPAIVEEVESLDMDSLTLLSDQLLQKLGKGVVILGSEFQGKPSIIVRGSEDFIKKGFNAGEIAGSLGKILQGSGGGKPEMGRAGGKAPEKLKEALKKAREILKDANLGP